MRQTWAFRRTQKLMRPGRISLHGFLGSDKRVLADILEADEAEVRRHGITHQQIADRLVALAEAGRDIAEREIVVENRYRVRVRDDRGVMPSPFGDGEFGKGDVALTDPTTNLQFRWNELTIHMIRHHGFYGGHGSLYRIDPAEAIQAFELHPDSGAETSGPAS